MPAHTQSYTCSRMGDENRQQGNAIPTNIEEARAANKQLSPPVHRWAKNSGKKYIYKLTVTFFLILPLNSTIDTSITFITFKSQPISI